MHTISIDGHIQSRGDSLSSDFGEEEEGEDDFLSDGSIGLSEIMDLNRDKEVYKALSRFQQLKSFVSRNVCRFPNYAHKWDMRPWPRSYVFQCAKQNQNSKNSQKYKQKYKSHKKMFFWTMYLFFLWTGSKISPLGKDSEDDHIPYKLIMLYINWKYIVRLDRRELSIRL